MRKFDNNGLRLAELQGKLFEKSADRFDCSSNIFIRRFLLSDIIKTLDKNEISIVQFSVDEALDEIEKKFGPSEYGTIKYSKEILFWLGYLYRYISYTRDISTHLLFIFFDHHQVSSLYYTYHTQDMEWCVKNLLKMNNYKNDIFDKNQRLKYIIKKSHES